MTKTHSTRLTVVIAAEIADAIDHYHSPTDGAIALGQVRQEIPQHHRSQGTWSWLPFRRSRVRLYRGGLEWSGMGFSYVQIGTVLHVVDVWSIRQQRLDVVLPMPADDCTYEDASLDDLLIPTI